VWLLQRRVARGAAKERTRDTVRVIAKRGLGAKAQVVVVEIDDVRYVLGVGDGAVSVIDRLSPEAAEAGARPAIAAVAPVTVLPSRTASASATPSATDPDAPLPARRTLRADRAAGASARTTGRTTSLPRDAAQALRRALGA